MSILVNAQTRVLVQGLTGREGQFHTRRMLDCGTAVVGGVTPGRGGQTVLGLPVFDSMAEAVAATGADTTIIFVPSALAADSACEAAAAGIRLVVLITEHIPVLDMIRARDFVHGHGALLLGPNSPGVVSPGQCTLGIMPAYIHRPGAAGVISRSCTLAYEAVYQLSQAGLGQSTCVGIGGDAVSGLGFIELLELFRHDPETHAVCLIGEIGGDAEERTAAYIRDTGYEKPVFGFIAGLAAPRGKCMGHAGAIISGIGGDAQGKLAAWREAGVLVVDELWRFGKTVAESLNKNE